MKKIQDKISELADAEEWIKLEEFILKKQPEIKNLIKKIIFSREGPHLLGNILKPLQCKTDASTSLKSKIYESVLSLVKCNEDEDEDETETENGKVMTVLAMHVDAFPSPVLLALINIYVEHLESGFPFYGRWANLLSKLLFTCADLREDLEVDGETMSGKDFQNRTLAKICACQWDAQTASTLLQVFRSKHITDLKMPKLKKLRKLKQLEGKLASESRRISKQTFCTTVYSGGEGASNVQDSVQHIAPPQKVAVMVNYDDFMPGNTTCDADTIEIQTEEGDGENDIDEDSQDVSGIAGTITTRISNKQERMAKKQTTRRSMAVEEQKRKKMRLINLAVEAGLIG